MSKNTKFYAVREGRKVGIFTTWTETMCQVSGYQGADYKSFDDINDAKKWIGEKFKKNKNIKGVKKKKVNADELDKILKNAYKGRGKVKSPIDKYMENRV